MATGASRLEAAQSIAQRVLGPNTPVQVEAAGSGVSTDVYRIFRGDEIFYLRILPEAGASFEPETRVHRILAELGVRVPDVVYYEDSNELLQRSVMITTAIPGQSIADAGTGPETRQILYNAGRDLARVNSVPVAGFGWIKRDFRVAEDHLMAERATFRDFIFDPYDSLNEYLGFLEFYLFREREIAAIRRCVARLEPEFDATSSRLAHGDFDTTHIYQQDGQYTGIIDFGEIRGTDQWYDLAHFRVHDGERLPAGLLPWLLEGYRAEVEIPDDIEERLALLGLIIAVRALGRDLKRNAVTQSNLQRHLNAAIERDLRLLR